MVGPRAPRLAAPLDHVGAGPGVGRAVAREQRQGGVLEPEVAALRRAARQGPRVAIGGRSHSRRAACARPCSSGSAASMRRHVRPEALPLLALGVGQLRQRRRVTHAGQGRVRLPGGERPVPSRLSPVVEQPGRQLQVGSQPVQACGAGRLAPARQPCILESPGRPRPEVAQAASYRKCTSSAPSLGWLLGSSRTACWKWSMASASRPLACRASRQIGVGVGVLGVEAGRLAASGRWPRPAGPWRYNATPRLSWPYADLGSMLTLCRKWSMASSSRPDRPGPCRGCCEARRISGSMLRACWKWLDRLIQPALGVESEGEIVVGRAYSWGRAGGLAPRWSIGLVHPAHGRQDHAEAVVGCTGLGPQRQRRTEDSRGPRPTAAPGSASSQAQSRARSPAGNVLCDRGQQRHRLPAALARDPAQSGRQLRRQLSHPQLPGERVSRAASCHSSGWRRRSRTASGSAPRATASSHSRRRRSGVMLAQSSRAATISARTAESRTAAATASLSSPSRPNPASANADNTAARPRPGRRSRPLHERRRPGPGVVQALRQIPGRPWPGPPAGAGRPAPPAPPAAGPAPAVPALRGSGTPGGDSRPEPRPCRPRCATPHVARPAAARATPRRRSPARPGPAP